MQTHFTDYHLPNGEKIPVNLDLPGVEEVIKLGLSNWIEVGEGTHLGIFMGTFVLRVVGTVLDGPTSWSPREARYFRVSADLLWPARDIVVAALRAHVGTVGLDNWGVVPAIWRNQKFRYYRQPRRNDCRWGYNSPITGYSAVFTFDPRHEAWREDFRMDEDPFVQAMRKEALLR